MGIPEVVAIIKGDNPFGIVFTKHDRSRKENANGEIVELANARYAGLSHDKKANGTIGVKSEGRIYPVHILLIKTINGQRFRP